MFLFNKKGQNNKVRSNRHSKRQATRRQFQFEQLEARVVMDASGGLEPSLPNEDPILDDGTEVQVAAAILDNAGTLKVYGTSSDDEIRVSAGFFLPNQFDLPSEPGVKVTIRDSNGQLIFTNIFNQGFITSIEVYAYAGNDTVINNTAIDSILDGGSGNDNLYGGGGVDLLLGQDGMDGFIVGELDSYYGGSGADRALVFPGQGFQVTDFQKGTDAPIFLYNEPSFQVQAGDELYTYDSGQWSQQELINIDQILQVMHYKTATTQLLADAAAGGLSLHRMGLQTSDNGGTEASAWNILNGDIYISQDAINHGQDWIAQTIYHEFGHNWDDNNPYWNNFLAISGWTEAPWLTPLSFLQSNTKSKDGEWYYDSSATFARDYATANPVEDFAASFAAYFMDEAGMTFIGNPSAPGQPVGSAAIPDKIALIDAWVASITDHPSEIGLTTQADLAENAGRIAASNESGRKVDDSSSTPRAIFFPQQEQQTQESVDGRVASSIDQTATTSEKSPTEDDATAAELSSAAFDKALIELMDERWHWR